MVADGRAAAGSLGPNFARRTFASAPVRPRGLGTVFGVREILAEASLSTCDGESDIGTTLEDATDARAKQAERRHRICSRGRRRLSHGSAVAKSDRIVPFSA